MITQAHSSLEGSSRQRELVDIYELWRDAWLDLLGVYGPVICTLTPGGLSAANMINVFPDLLHISVWAALVFALITVASVEILALLATDRNYQSHFA